MPDPETDIRDQGTDPKLKGAVHAFSIIFGQVFWSIFAVLFWLDVNDTASDDFERKVTGLAILFTFGLASIFSYRAFTQRPQAKIRTNELVQAALWGLAAALFYYGLQMGLSFVVAQFIR